MNTSIAVPLPICLDVLPEAGSALAHPPSDLGQTIDYLRTRYAHRRYTIPLGWERAEQGTPVCVVAHLLDDVYHCLLTAKSRVGKDNAAILWLLTLALQNPPTRLQVAIIDGKGGLDWAGWGGKAHTWRLAIDKGQITPAMTALTAERERRMHVLRHAGVSAWEGYQGDDLPLLVVYVSELLLLQDATSSKELDRWLSSELSSAAAFGIRYIVATQTASQFSTRWRGQVDLFVAGFQPSASQDQPNTGLTPAEIRAAGAVPPSELPGLPHGRGVFTLVQGRQCETVRIGYIDDAQRRRWLALLPNQPLAVTERAVVPLAAEPWLASAALFGPSQESSQEVLWHADQGLPSGVVAEVAVDLTDDDISALLRAATPMRRIAARLKGRMQSRLRRIHAVRAQIQPGPRSDA